MGRSALGNVSDGCRLRCRARAEGEAIHHALDRSRTRHRAGACRRAVDVESGSPAAVLGRVGERPSRQPRGEDLGADQRRSARHVHQGQEPVQSSVAVGSRRPGHAGLLPDRAVSDGSGGHLHDRLVGPARIGPVVRLRHAVRHHNGRAVHRRHDRSDRLSARAIQAGQGLPARTFLGELRRHPGSGPRPGAVLRVHRDGTDGPSTPVGEAGLRLHARRVPRSRRHTHG